MPASPVLGGKTFSSKLLLSTDENSAGGEHDKQRYFGDQAPSLSTRRTCREDCRHRGGPGANMRPGDGEDVPQRQAALADAMNARSPSPPTNSRMSPMWHDIPKVTT
jgi:hypothetical protein